VCVGLTVVYAVSGVAVNHVRDWNPNYRLSVDTFPVPGLTRLELGRSGYADEVVARLGLEGPVRGTFRPDSATLDIFLAETSVRVSADAAEATVEQVRARAALRQANLLHLNEPRGVWTYVADLFAVSLILLAISGLFMMKGKYGVTGRGAWLTGAGVLLPLLFLLLFG
jgi:hypothetical protein